MWYGLKLVCMYLIPMWHNFNIDVAGYIFVGTQNEILVSTFSAGVVEFIFKTYYKY